MVAMFYDGLQWRFIHPFRSLDADDFLSRGMPINQLEMLAVLIAVRFWAHKCSAGRVQITMSR